MYDIRAIFRGDGGIDDDNTNTLFNEATGNHPVDRVIFHPMYDHNRFHYDIAVLHLATPETTVMPINLAEPTRKSSYDFQNPVITKYDASIII